MTEHNESTMAKVMLRDELVTHCFQKVTHAQHLQHDQILTKQKIPTHDKALKPNHTCAIL